MRQACIHKKPKARLAVVSIQDLLSGGEEKKEKKKKEVHCEFTLITGFLLREFTAAIT